MRATARNTGGENGWKRNITEETEEKAVVDVATVCCGGNLRYIPLYSVKFRSASVCLQTVVCLPVCNNHKRCLPAHGGCEAVAAERARLRQGYAGAHDRVSITKATFAPAANTRVPHAKKSPEGELPGSGTRREFIFYASTLATSFSRALELRMSKRRSSMAPDLRSVSRRALGL